MDNIFKHIPYLPQDLEIIWLTNDGSRQKSLHQNTILSGVYDDRKAVQSNNLPQGWLNENQWINHRVFSIKIGVTTIQIGQTVYNSKEDALQGMDNETFDIAPELKGEKHMATITMRGGAKDLSDPNDAEFTVKGGER